MKKTIIALLALAGVAAADTPEIITLWETGFAITTEGANAGKWTVSSEDTQYLTSSAWILTKADGSALLSTVTNSAELRPNTNVGSAQGWSLDFTLSNTSEDTFVITSLTFDTLTFTSGGAYQGNGTPRDFEFTLTCGEKTVTSGNWTISGTNPGSDSPTNGVVTLTFTEGIELTANEKVAVSFDVAKGTSNAGCFLGLKSITASGQLIPEPATATLSLLALCGLAARRRRS